MSRFQRLLFTFFNSSFCHWKKGLHGIFCNSFCWQNELRFIVCPQWTVFLMNSLSWDIMQSIKGHWNQINKRATSGCRHSTYIVIWIYGYIYPYNYLHWHYLPAIHHVQNGRTGKLTHHEICTSVTVVCTLVIQPCVGQVKMSNTDKRVLLCYCQCLAALIVFMCYKCIRCSCVHPAMTRQKTQVRIKADVCHLHSVSLLRKVYHSLTQCILGIF